MSDAEGRRPAICEGVRMIPAPIELPRVTATPNVTPSTRSKLPVAGLGLALTPLGSICPLESLDSATLHLAGKTAVGEDTREPCEGNPVASRLRWSNVRIIRQQKLQKFAEGAASVAVFVLLLLRDLGVGFAQLFEIENWIVAET